MSFVLGWDLQGDEHSLLSQRCTLNECLARDSKGSAKDHQRKARGKKWIRTWIGDGLP